MANEDACAAGLQDWEKAAISYWAARVPEPAQQEELRAELVKKLLTLRAKPRSGIRYPKAYVRTALANTAKTWFKKYNAAKQTIPLEESPAAESFEEPGPRAARDIGRDEGDFGVALGRFWEDLDPRLQRFLIVLERQNGNLSAAAMALRIHRNTASQWRNKIRALVRKHRLAD